MLRNVFRETWRALIATIESVERGGDTPREQLRKVAEILLRSWKRDPDLVRVLVLEVTRSQQLAGEMDEIVASFAAIQEIVERGQADGDDPRRPRCAARELRLLRRGRGAADGLGARAAAGFGRGRRPGRADRWSRSSRAASLPSSRARRRDRRPHRRRRRSSALPPVRRRLLWSLGLGAFGLAFSVTTTAAYLPPLLQPLHGLRRR